MADLGTSFNKLQDTSIIAVDTSKCEQQYEDEKSVIIDEKVICAGEPGKDSCQVLNKNCIFRSYYF